MVNFRCPVCQQVSLTLDNGSVSINGNVTIVTDFPPPDWNMPFAKCNDHDAFLVPDGQGHGGSNSGNGGGGPGGGGTAKLGDMDLQAGDWLLTAGSMGDVYYHHFIYVGNTTFVSRQKNGVVQEQGNKYEGKKATLVCRGGQGAADKALARVGEGGYCLMSKNCEHFCSEVCGHGHESRQVVVGTGKLLATTVSLLGSAIQSEGSNFRMVGGTTGGFSAGRGGFSVGIRCSF